MERFSLGPLFKKNAIYVFVVFTNPSPKKSYRKRRARF